MTKSELTQPSFVCLFCTFLHKDATEKDILYTFLVTGKIESKAVTNMSHVNEMLHLSVIQEICIIHVLQGLQVKQFLASC